jgi:hypothetical protein
MAGFICWLRRRRNMTNFPDEVWISEKLHGGFYVVDFIIEADEDDRNRYIHESKVAALTEQNEKYLLTIMNLHDEADNLKQRVAELEEQVHKLK